MTDFESGDLVWPKVPGAYIPFSQVDDDSYEAEKTKWIREKDAYLLALNNTCPDKAYCLELTESLTNLSFDDFLVAYQEDRDPSQFVPYGAGGRLSVGHVAVVKVDDDGSMKIVEAMPESGVQIVELEAWAAKRTQEVFWHGRLEGLTRERREAIALEAAKFSGTPYSLWSMNLSDSSTFYCSKLVWLSILSATGVAVDGNTSPRRNFWFTPKRLMKCVDRVRVLCAPPDGKVY